MFLVNLEEGGEKVNWEYLNLNPKFKIRSQTVSFCEEFFTFKLHTEFKGERKYKKLLQHVNVKTLCLISC